MDLNLDTPVAGFAFEARMAVSKRRQEMGGEPAHQDGQIGAMTREMLAWQEVQTLLLKAILDELVKARKGIRT